MIQKLAEEKEGTSVRKRILKIGFVCPDPGCENSLGILGDEGDLGVSDSTFRSFLRMASSRAPFRPVPTPGG